MASKKDTKTQKKSAQKQKKDNRSPLAVSQGRMYVKATFNNTIVNFTDTQGNTITTVSTGQVGFKGTRKSTPYAATTTLQEAVKRAKEKGLKSVEVYIKGPGPGRDSALRVLRNAGLEINKITDVTPLPHNGCRPKKPRRV